MSIFFHVNCGLFALADDCFYTLVNVGKGDSFKIYERIFDGPGITIHTDAVIGGPDVKNDTEVEFTVTLKQNRFLSDIKVCPYLGNQQPAFW